MRSKSNQNKLMKIITMPFKFLKKGKDMYVRSMMDYAEKPRHGSSSSNLMGSMKKGQAVSGLPKSFSSSVTSSWSSNLESDDLRELIRANSTSISNDPKNKLRADMEMYLKQLIKEQQIKQLDQQSLEIISKSRSSKSGVVPRSWSVGMGKIDEEKPFEEDEEEEEEGTTNTNTFKGLYKTDVLYPRSRSHAVKQTNVVF